MNFSDLVNVTMKVTIRLIRYIHRLDVNLKDYLRKFGIEDVDDLQVLFADMSLLQKCKAGMAPEDFPRFGKAFQKYMIDMQDDDITVKIVTKAETSSHGSSSSTSSRKRQLQSEENASVEDKRSRRIAGETFCAPFMYSSIT